MTFTVYGVYMTINKQSRLFSFRVPADLADDVDEAVRRAGRDKSSWVLGAVFEKLGRPDDTRSPESRMEGLISQMESLISGAKTLPATGNQPAAISGPTRHHTINRQRGDRRHGGRGQDAGHPVEQ